jgi:hypothetical protein
LAVSNHDLLQVVFAEYLAAITPHPTRVRGVNPLVRSTVGSTPTDPELVFIRSVHLIVVSL